MATATQARPAGASPPAEAVVLPTIDVAKLEEIGYLLERTVDENTDLFISKGNAFKERHRAGTKRPLSWEEAAQVAGAIVGDDRSVEELAEAFQSREGLYAYDEPDAREVLFQAGIATAPAAIVAARKLVALIEMAPDVFWEAYDDTAAGGPQPGLDEAINTGAKALLRLDSHTARERASAALMHFAAAVGDDSGKGPWLMAKSLWQALSQAMGHLMTSDVSALSSLLGSVPPASAPDATSSGSPTATPES